MKNVFCKGTHHRFVEMSRTLPLCWSHLLSPIDAACIPNDRRFIWGCNKLLLYHAHELFLISHLSVATNNRVVNSIRLILFVKVHNTVFSKYANKCFNLLSPIVNPCIQNDKHFIWRYNKLILRHAHKLALISHLICTNAGTSSCICNVDYVCACAMLSL